MKLYILSSDLTAENPLKNVLALYWNIPPRILNPKSSQFSSEINFDEPVVCFFMQDQFSAKEIAEILSLIPECVPIFYSSDIDRKSQDEVFHSGTAPIHLKSFNLNSEYMKLLKEAVISRIELRELKDSLELLRGNIGEWENLFQDSLDIMFIIDASSKKIVETNHAASIVLGYTKDEMIGRDFSFLSQSKRNDKDESAEFHGYTIANHGLVTATDVWIPMESTWRIFQRNGITHIFATFRDISERKASEEKIHYLAYYNSITNLPNRIYFEDRLNQFIHDSHSTKQMFAVVTVDVDNFKLFNETLGSEFGDKLLRSIGEKFYSLALPQSFFAHFGGDDFGLLLLIESPEDMERKIKKILQDMRASLLLDGREFFISYSYGIAIYPNHGQYSKDLMKSADLAMYTAKERGKNSYSIFHESMIEKVHRRMELENDLRRAIQNEEFRLYFQPQISIETGKLCGMEALVRWYHPTKGIISPMEFIPVAELSGLIQEIGFFVLKTACKIAKKWIDQGLLDCPVSVNVSAKQWNNMSLSSEISGILSETGLPSKLLTIELTESSIMEDPEKSIRAFQELINQGVGLSVDDFGTGYSSLSYLKKLKVHHLKIDRSFVKELESNASDRAISQAVIDLAHSLGLSVVAEGVEKVEQLAILRDQGCDSFQGFLVSKPLSEKDFEELLRNYRESNHGYTFI